MPRVCHDDGVTAQPVPASQLPSQFFTFLYDMRKERELIGLVWEVGEEGRLLKVFF